MASFKIKCSKNKAQTVITVKQTDSVDLIGVAEIVVSLYSDDISTADNTYTLDATELSAFKTDGTVNLNVSDVIGASPADDFYLVEFSADSGSYLSNKAGLAITLEAAGRVYSKQGFVDVYAPDFRIDRVLHTVHMLFQEMNLIEELDTSLQKRADFTTRLSLLKEILQY
jgi:hypothetical protein